jgi:hypothetical protein
MNPSEIMLKGNAEIGTNATLLDFWRWAFSDLCDDDIKGIFAEWMVSLLLDLPLALSRRVSWADSDIGLSNGTRIEVKASALWQSWKLVNPDGTRKPVPPPAVLNSNRIRFGGLQARKAIGISPATLSANKQLKSDIYIFCMNTQTDAAKWDAWNLADWEFYVMTAQELNASKVGSSISLAALRRVRPAMSASEFQSYAKSRFLGNLACPMASDPGC